MSQQRQDDGENEARTVCQHACRPMESAVWDEAGVAAIEYALLAALIAVVVAGSVTSVGTGLNGLWTLVADAVAAAMTGL